MQRSHSDTSPYSPSDVSAPSTGTSFTADEHASHHTPTTGQALMDSPFARPGRSGRSENGLAI
jgi:hypothetical protein